MLVKDSPNAEQMSNEIHDQVLHAALKSEKIEFYASDLMGYGPANHGNTLSLCIVGESKQEVEDLFKKLSDGATSTTPLKEEFFGTYGDLTDKYGFRWMFQYSPDQQ